MSRAAKAALRGLTRLKGALARMRIDADTRAFIRHCREVFRDYRVARPEGEILVELYTVTQTVISFAYAVNLLARKHGAEIRSFSWSPWDEMVFRLAFRKFLKTYESFNAVGYLHARPPRGRNPERDELLRAALADARTREAIFRLEIRGIAVGCEIYETYLREFWRPTVDPADPRVAELIEFAVDSILFWEDYLESHRVKAIVVSHGVYRYGFLTRVARKRGIPVYLPNIRGISRMTRAGKPGVPEFRDYPSLFREIPEAQRAEGLELARKQLERRFSAEVGVNMAYSTKSAFGRSRTSGSVLRKSDRLKVLVTTHCFFDNPQAYGDTLFDDFHAWMTFLGELSGSTDYDWYLKTHPDVLPANEPVIAELLARHPRFTRVPSSVSFHQLIEEGLSHVLTVYGSVGHELPLLGATVVNAGYNPHVAYPFNVHPRSLEEYRRILLDLGRVRPEIDRRQVYEFYYTHHYLAIADDFLVGSFARFLKEVSPEGQIGAPAYAYYLKEFSREKAQAVMDRMRWFVDSGEPFYFEHRYRKACSTASATLWQPAPSMPATPGA